MVLFPRPSRLSGSSQHRAQGPEDLADPEMMQQYLDYMILDPSQSSIHMQTPLLDPYTYRQVGKRMVHVPGPGKDRSKYLK